MLKRTLRLTHSGTQESPKPVSKALEALKNDKLLLSLVTDHTQDNLRGIEELIGRPLKKPQISREVLEDREEREGWRWSKQEYLKGCAFITKILGPVLNGIIYFPKLKVYYIYNYNVGAYAEQEPEVVRTALQCWLGATVYRFAGDNNRRLLEVEKQFPTYIKINLDLPLSDIRYMSMKNGLFNKVSRVLEGKNPDIFTTGSCRYSYDSNARCPRFLEFLNSFCDGHQDRVNLLRSFMWSVIFNYTNPQIFLYISGPGATGKSIFTHVLSALLPPEAVVSTRLRDLNLDKFEVLNISWKHLVILNDIEDYTGDMSVLKAFVGQDILKGSRKYVQGSFKVHPTGILMALGNHSFASQRDSGGALSRRVLPFSSNNVSSSRTPLIRPLLKEGYEGPLWDEIPGILNWVLAWDQEKSHDYLTKYQYMVPSLKEHFLEVKDNISPLTSWAEESLVRAPETERAHLGTKSSPRETHLYAHYIHFVLEGRNIPMSQRKFINDLKNYLTQKRWPHEYVRTMHGRALTGVALRTHSSSITGELEGANLEDKGAPFSIGSRSKEPDVPLEKGSASNESAGSKGDQVGEEPILLSDIRQDPPVDESHFKRGEDNPKEYLQELERIRNATQVSWEDLERARSSQFSWEDLERARSAELAPPKGIGSSVSTDSHGAAREVGDSYCFFGKKQPFIDNYNAYLAMLNTNKEGKSQVFQRIADETSRYASVLRDNPSQFKEFRDQYLKILGYPDDQESKDRDGSLKKFSSYLRKSSEGAFGCTSYEPCPASPRIRPTVKSLNPNYFRKAFSHLFLSSLLSHPSTNLIDLSLVDLDISSCYVSLLCAFFPEETVTMREFITTKGIWEVIRDQMSKEGKSHLFNKAWCKVAVYSSFFGGGPSAIISHIVDSERKIRHLTPDEWASHPEKPRIHKEASEFGHYLNCSLVLQTFRKISSDLRTLLLKPPFSSDKIFEGPLGFSWPLDGPAWRSSYSCILQELEIALVSSTLVRLRDQSGILDPSKWDLIMHSHDGVLLVTDKVLLPSLTSEFTRVSQGVARELGASLPQFIHWEMKVL